MSSKKKTPESAVQFLAEMAADQGHEEQINRYNAAKIRQKSVSEYILQYKPEFIKEGENLQCCGCWLYFRHFYLVGEYRLLNGMFCQKFLLCPLCAIRRSGCQSMEYGLKIQQVLLDTDCIPVLITRTVKNGSDLFERYSHLNKAHRKMIQRRRTALRAKELRVKNPSVMGHILGSVGSYEFKRGKDSGLWHPHSHEIALLKPGFDFHPMVIKGKDVLVPVDFQQRLSDEWLQVTKDSFIVDVRMLDISTDSAFKNGVAEAFKYSLKFNELAIEDQVHAYSVLRRRRLLFSYGCLRNVEVSDSLLDDIDDRLALEPWMDILYKFAFDGYVVDRTDNTGKMAEEYLIFDNSSLSAEERKELREEAKKKKKSQASKAKIRNQERALADMELEEKFALFQKGLLDPPF